MNSEWTKFSNTNTTWEKVQLQKLANCIQTWKGSNERLFNISIM